MKNIFIALLLLSITACQGTQTSKATDANKPSVETESVAATTTENTAADETQLPAEMEEDMANIPAGGLNAIRFEGWTDKDWLDNDYIKEMRKFFNTYTLGEMNDERFESLAPYKSLMNSKFIVLYIQPFLGGGVFMYIVFIDNPKQVFEAWVYGIIEDEDNGVVGYDVRLCRPSKEENELSKNEILQIIKEHPENKLW